MCCEYGYTRKSTPKQSIDRQIRNIRAVYPNAIILQETYTGTKIDRKEWNKLYKAVKEGDTIIFDSVSRMSRNAAEGFEAYEALYNRGVNLVFLKEPHINTDVFKNAIAVSVPMTGTNIDYILEGVNKYLMAIAKEQIRLAFEQSEKEVEDLHQRTKEGLETARLNGKQIGLAKGTKLTTKKSIAAKEQIIKYSKDFDGTLDDTAVMKLTGLARNTYYKYKREIKEGVQADRGWQSRVQKESGAACPTLLFFPIFKQGGNRHVQNLCQTIQFYICYCSLFFFYPGYRTTANINCQHFQFVG